MRLDQTNTEVRGIYPGLDPYNYEDPGAVEPIDICRKCWETIFDGDETVLIDHPPYNAISGFKYHCFDCNEELHAIDNENFKHGTCEVCGDSDTDLDTGLCEQHQDVHPTGCSGIDCVQVHEHSNPYENDNGECIYLVDPICTYPNRPIQVCQCSTCPLGGDFWTTHNTAALTDTRQPPTWSDRKIDPLRKVEWHDDDGTWSFYTLDGVFIRAPGAALSNELHSYLGDLKDQQFDLVLDEITDLLKTEEDDPVDEVEISTSKRWHALAQVESDIHILDPDSCVLRLMSIPTLVQFYWDCQNDGDEDAESIATTILKHVAVHRGIKAITLFAIHYEGLRDERSRR